MNAATRQIILVTGAARSGKSEWAEILASQISKNVLYVATSVIDTEDQEWLHRIQKHQLRRSPEWQTLEVPKELTKIISNHSSPSCLLIDSLGTWVANFLDQDELLWQEIVVDLLKSLENSTADVILVAEETGWGLVPAYPIGRLFRDRLGMLTRQIGAKATTVYLVTGGHVLNLSILGQPLPSHRKISSLISD